MASTPQLPNNFVKSPRQATTIFGLDGSSIPRKKSLFVVRFQRGSGQQGTTSSWQQNLGFMVKSVDRPSIQPEVVEVNQYNKKRQITTGVKYMPMKMTLYDTADSLVMRMWNEYSQWYFGDFQQADASGWNYDVTTSNFNDGGQGFGFQPRPGNAITSSGADNTPIDQSSQFFFSTIEIYQVWGGQYLQFNLINPKISAFDPDEMDYSVTELSMINITFAYEAIQYVNNNLPQPISQSSTLSTIFGTAGDFNGNTFDVQGSAVRKETVASPIQTSAPGVFDFTNSQLPGLSSTVTGSSGNTLGGGSLSQFGDFSFGTDPITGASATSSLAYQASGNTGLATVLNLPVGTPAATNPEGIGLTGTGTTSAINASTIGATQDALTGADGGSNPYGSTYISSNLIPGVAASSIINGNSPSDQLSQTDQGGLTLNPTSYGIINAQRPAYSQIGYNFNSSDTSVGGRVVPGQYNTSGIPVAPIPYTGLNQIDPADGGVGQTINFFTGN
jgi:hypothetical protein